MTQMETFAGSFIEALTICCLISLFNSGYGEGKIKMAVISVVIAGITTITDSIYIPAGYSINYFTFILLLSVLLKMRFIHVVFEFLLAFSMLALFEVLFLFFSSKIGIMNSLSLLDRMSHLLLILTLCFLAANSKKLKLKVRHSYIKYREEIYLVTGNIFLVTLIGLYYWDADHETFFQELGIITAFVLAWCVLNIYLLKKLTENHRQKELISIHERYIEMTDSLLDGYGLYNVSNISSKYNGTLHIFYEDDQLVVQVLFQ